MNSFSGIKQLLILFGLNAEQFVQENIRARIQRVVARFITAACLFFWVAAQVFCLIHVNEKRFASVAHLFNMIRANKNIDEKMAKYVCTYGRKLLKILMIDILIFESITM